MLKLFPLFDFSVFFIQLLTSFWNNFLLHFVISLDSFTSLPFPLSFVCLCNSASFTIIYPYQRCKKNWNRGVLRPPHPPPTPFVPVIGTKKPSFESNYTLHMQQKGEIGRHPPTSVLGPNKAHIDKISKLSEIIRICWYVVVMQKVYKHNGF